MERFFDLPLNFLVNAIIMAPEFTHIIEDGKWGRIMGYISVGKLAIAADLYEFVNQELLSGLTISSDDFWAGFDKAVHELAPKNKALLEKRETLQKQIDDYHIAHRETGFDSDHYQNFLKEIGYLVPEGPAFSIETSKVDPEIATIAGPQLVVPVMNARYALNAANARWGSLYDALYGTDAISEEEGAERSASYNPVRGQKVIETARSFLNEAAPLSLGDWHDVTGFSVIDGVLVISMGDTKTYLRDQTQFAGYNGSAQMPTSILLKRHNLHIDILVDSKGAIGATDKAHINDIILESAISTIMDCEDSVAAVDSEDKVIAYANWLGLMKGDLSIEMTKKGQSFTRSLNPDRYYTSPQGGEVRLSGRSLMLVRNVGHLMTNPAILLDGGDEIPEGIMDGFMTTLAAMHDFARAEEGLASNSKSGSIYIVKPKMHGPEEVGFATEIFDAVEALLGLPANSMKIGIMDEERRTTVNLKECIRAAKNRVVFINTGFLDRTGDEIHTSIEAGPMIRKGDMKQATWISSYENWNVDIGLECGFSGKAQIGKGMWAMPDLMAAMIDQKIGHPLSGANCAWVPSPTAATLHAMHYHHVDVFAKQAELSQRERADIGDILTIPVASRPNWSQNDINQELENNAQGILGYVVRWIDQGVGCSKVPDINDVGLMEDRATLRISSQHIANWLHHGICSQDQVMAVMKKMAAIVDEQNKEDTDYQPMAADFENSVAFKAACDLVFEGRIQPSGYTEPVLHKRRLEYKALRAS